MVKSRHATIQLGKLGITDNFIDTLKSYFKDRQNVKVSVLKSAGHEKEEVKKFRDEIISRLGNNYTGRIVGFSIFLKKWRRSKVDEKD